MLSSLIISTRESSSPSHMLSSVSWVASDILLVLPLKLLDKVVDYSDVRVLTTKVIVTSCCFDLKDTLLDGDQRLPSILGGLPLGVIQVVGQAGTATKTFLSEGLLMNETPEAVKAWT